MKGTETLVRNMLTYQNHYYAQGRIQEFRLGGGAMMDVTGDHLSGAPPLVGAERPRKFWDFDTPQIIGNGTFELEIANLL